MSCVSLRFGELRTTALFACIALAIAALLSNCRLTRQSDCAPRAFWRVSSCGLYFFDDEAISTQYEREN
jgi:hypothetical protein